LSSPTAKTAEPILTHDDGVSAKEVPFGVSMTKNNVQGSTPPKKQILRAGISDLSQFIKFSNYHISESSKVIETKI